jgi:hypothetical protein
MSVVVNSHDYQILKTYFNHVPSKITFKKAGGSRETFLLCHQIYSKTTELALSKIEVVVKSNAARKDAPSEGETKVKKEMQVTVQTKAVGALAATRSAKKKDRNKSKSEVTIDDINQACTPHKLTPLHVSVIVGNLPVVDALLKAKANPNAQDIRGWTPGHHAALYPGNEILRLLMTSGLVSSTVNQRNGTWQDLRRLCYSPTLAKPKEAQVLFLDDKSGKVVPKNGLDFEEATGAKFINEMDLTPKILIEEWSSVQMAPVKDNLRAFNERMAKEYAEFRKNAPKVYIAPPKDEMGRIIDGIGLGVYAGQAIEKGRIICEYVGEEAQEKASGEYLFGTIDPIKKGGYSRLINDGFPNCVAVPLYDCNGIKERTVFMALDNIKEGEHLQFDYCEHDIKLKHHLELCPLAVRNFIKLHGVPKLIAFIISFQSNNSYGHENVSEIMKMLYIINTPATLISVVLEGLINLEELTEFYRILADKFGNFRDVSDKFLFPLLKFLENKPVNVQKVIKKAIIDSLEKHNLQVIISGISNLLLQFDDWSLNKNEQELCIHIANRWQILIRELRELFSKMKAAKDPSLHNALVEDPTL